ncbi:baseplate wedge subunit [uncultured Caudovirales phage]|uniref:Baseplate wedge subunit n=1 Tax=uncultured Caudovirales phage TaxID=2100421 RepID=A0A6J7WTL2_9CAUD|nr:baseplate wedge subunit [uncultured Caudovirales phage]
MSMFNYFPYIYYNNVKSTHLLIKEQIIKQYLKDYSKFFAYTIRENERADAIAYNQYGDSSLDWTIFIINDITDPYKDWPLDEKQFRNYLEAKYNVAVEKLMTTLIDSSIHHYYYKGIASDTDQDIASYNYTMTPFTYEQLGQPAGWVAKSIYEVESEINESKRNIKILNPIFINDFKQQFKDLIING